MFAAAAYIAKANAAKDSVAHFLRGRILTVSSKTVLQLHFTLFTRKSAEEKIVICGQCAFHGISKVSIPFLSFSQDWIRIALG